MAKEDVLFKAIFAIFLGFMLFISAILNKVFFFWSFLTDYFVLFIFTGIVVSVIGMALAIIWRFENRNPFEEEIQQPRVQTKFAPFLGLGIFLVIAGFTGIFYHSSLNKIFITGSWSISILGILLMMIGLVYYVTEVMRKAKRVPSHS